MYSIEKLAGMFHGCFMKKEKAVCQSSKIRLRQVWWCGALWWHVTTCDELRWLVTTCAGMWRWECRRHMSDDEVVEPRSRQQWQRRRQWRRQQRWQRRWRQRISWSHDIRRFKIYFLRLWFEFNETSGRRFLAKSISRWRKKTRLSLKSELQSLNLTAGSQNTV